MLVSWAMGGVASLHFSAHPGQNRADALQACLAQAQSTPLPALLHASV